VTKRHSKKDAHVECVSDFCGTHTHPGAWADIYQRKDGSQYIALGGGWAFYGKNTPTYVEESDPLYKPFLVACKNRTDFAFAHKHWDK